MDIVDGGTPGTVFRYGRTIDPDGSEKKTIPNSQLWTLYLSVAKNVFKIAALDLIVYATQAKRLEPVSDCEYGLLMCWSRTERNTYRLLEVNPSNKNDMNPARGLHKAN